MEPSMKRMPIPAFYCVYMLRAIDRPRCHVYIGSTPHPRRRLRQHNGELGRTGASKTVRLRPSEFAMFVWGFPSKVAALQFEWAWQNTYKSRHNDQQQKATRTEKTMKDKVDHLLILLRSKSFQQWPLRIRFFNQLVYDEWKKRTATDPVKFRVDVTIMDRQKILDGSSGIDVTYQPMKDQIAKSTALVQEDISLACAVCRKRLRPSSDMIAVCTAGTCRSASHLQCLAYRFREESVAPRVLIPEHGKCPDCHSKLSWIDVVRDASLRTDGTMQVEKLLKPARGAKAGTVQDEEDEDSDSGSDAVDGIGGQEAITDDVPTISPSRQKAKSSGAKSSASKQGAARTKKSAKKSTTPPKSTAKPASTRIPAIIPDSDDEFQDIDTIR